MKRFLLDEGLISESKEGFSVFRVVYNVERDETEILLFANKSLEGDKFC